MASRHVVALPRWFLVLRIFQILIAVAILGMSAYGIYWVPYNSWCLALFTSIATFIVVGYFLITHYAAACQAAYNYWAVLALDIFAIIFWLSSMSYLAATRSAFIYPTQIIDCVNYGFGSVCYKKRDTDFTKRDVATYGYLDMMSASAGLAGLELILFIVTLVIFSVHLHRHRSSGAPNTPSSAAPNPSSPGKPEVNSTGATSYAGAPQQQPQPEHAPPGQQYQSPPAQSPYQQPPSQV